MQAERYIAAADLGSSKIALSVAKIEGDDIQVINQSFQLLDRIIRF